MQARPALRAAWNNLASHPARAFATLVPLAPPALLSTLPSAHLPAALTWIAPIAAFALLGPALVGSYRLCLCLADGIQPRTPDWTAGLKFFWPALLVNVLRMAAAIVVLLPAIFALVLYFVISGSPMAQGASPAPLDFAATLLVTTPAAIIVICVKCLTCLFEIQLADGAETRFFPCLDSSIRIAWRNITPIAWMFTYLGLAALPLLALAYFAAAPLAPFVATPAASPAFARLAAIELALKILILPILPWIFLTLVHAYRQVHPARQRDTGS